MSIIPQLLPIEFNHEQIKNTIITNTIKMLTSRKLLDASKMDNNIQKILSIKTDSTTSDNPLYEIKLDDIGQYYENTPDSRIMYVQMFKDKITGTKSPLVIEFLNKYKNNPKILIVSHMAKKAIDQITSNQKYVEVFNNDDLMINIEEHVAVPKHELLSEEETKMVLDEFSVKKKELPKIKIGDPMARFLNAKLGQIFRIISPSETAVLTPRYRVVVKGDVKTK